MTYGFAGFMGLAREAVWGTPVAATRYFEALSESIVSDLARFQIKNIVGGAVYEPDDETGVYTHQGNIVMATHPEVVGNFLRGSLGIQSTTVLLSGFLHRHEYTPLANDVGSAHANPPYTLEVFRDVTSSEQFAGGNFSTLEFSAAANQDLRMTVGFIGKSKLFIAASASAGNIIFPTSPIGVFKFDTCSISINNVAIDRIENIRLTFNPQIAGVTTLANSREITRIRRTGPQLVRIAGQIEFLDIADALDFENQTEKQIKINFVKAASFSLLFDIPRFVYSTFPRQIRGRDRIMVDFEMMGRWHIGSRNAMKVTLVTVNSF